MQSIIDSRQLLAFATLARVASFTQAAKELNLTQSAVSHAMKSLEEEVGCRLLERAARHVSLTLAGQKFLAHAEKILAEMSAARSGLDGITRWGQERLRIGAGPTICEFVLPTVIREFKQSFPGCTVQIEPGDHARQLELMASNQVDLAVMVAPSGHREFGLFPLFEDELAFIVAAQHPWAQSGRAPSGPAVAEETLILSMKTSLTFRLISQYFRDQGMQLGQFMELTSLGAIKELVKIGAGAAILAPWTVRADLDDGSLVMVPIGKRRLKRKWGVVYRKGRNLSLGEDAFVGLCRSVTENFGAPVDV